MYVSRLASMHGLTTVSPSLPVFRSSALLPFEYAPQIEHVARIAKITPTSGSTGFYFRIDNAAPILDDCHMGDSICVNGACLTVTEFGADYFDVNLANETLNRTNLGTTNGSYRNVS